MFAALLIFPESTFMEKTNLDMPRMGWQDICRDLTSLQCSVIHLVLPQKLSHLLPWLAQLLAVHMCGQNTFL